MFQRYLEKWVYQDLQKKMVFLGGPRQAGKTTLAEVILSRHYEKHGLYFNWDNDESRAALLKKEWGAETQFIVFDELHKFSRWKNWIKGVYDIEKKERSFLVTGSARLDIYKKGGDSLLGRYHYWRLHPLTLSELPGKISQQEAFQRLMTVGGFPEPFFDNNEREAKRWRRERFERVLKDDIRDLEALRDLSTLGLFVDALRTRVGSLVVLDNIAQELQVTHKTLKHWLEVLEKMYIIFVVRPWTKNVTRSVLKAPKVYFFDNADVIGDDGARFENLVATTLLKKLHFLEDRDGDRYELRYIRDKEGREVDFAIIKEGKLEQLVEAKFSDTDFSSALHYHVERLQPQSAVQIVANLKKERAKGRLKMESPFASLSQSLFSI